MEKVEAFDAKRLHLLAPYARLAAIVGPGHLMRGAWLRTAQKRSKIAAEGPSDEDSSGFL